ncbi:MAG: hypothetical protein IH849_10695, partial [Acidobacteria bacterium]|nr:hypothetical protein [Acidobacteriota bacterium]
MTSILVAAMFWPLACAVFVYIANRAELLQGFGAEVPEFLVVDNNFFVIFMNAQASFAIVLAALAGPSLIAPDLTNGALSLYFSRPLSRSEYVLGRMLALVGLLSAVTWIPGVLLFLMQSGMAGWSWFVTNWKLGAGIFFGFVLWIVLVGLVALASSAYVKWRIVAGALVLGGFFVMAGYELHLADLANLRWIGAAYVVCRTVGKILGAYLGMRWSGVGGELRPYLGMALLCQAAVIIGLADFVAEYWHQEWGRRFATVALGSVVIFEVAGPLLTKQCAKWAGELKAVTLLRRDQAAPAGTSILALTTQALLRTVGLSRAVRSGGDDRPLLAKDIMRTKHTQQADSHSQGKCKPCRHLGPRTHDSLSSNMGYLKDQQQKNRMCFFVLYNLNFSIKRDSWRGDFCGVTTTVIIVPTAPSLYMVAIPSAFAEGACAINEAEGWYQTFPLLQAKKLHS